MAGDRTPGLRVPSDASLITEAASHAVLSEASSLPLLGSASTRSATRSGQGVGEGRHVLKSAALPLHYVAATPLFYISARYQI